MAQAVQVSPPAADGESGVFRSVLSAPSGEIEWQVDGAATIHELFEKSVAKAPHNKCLGRRVGSSYSFISYEEVARLKNSFGRGLVWIYETLLQATGRFHVGIYASNSVEWIVADLGCHSFGLPVVALYDTLGPDASLFILNHAAIPVLVTHSSKLPTILPIAQKTALKAIITTDSPQGQLLDLAQKWAASVNIKLFSFEQVLKFGTEKDMPLRPPAPNDPFCICYTSGTTGNPKGAILTNKNMLAFQNAASKLLKLSPADTHISYLPLAHIFERCVLLYVLRNNASVGFFRGDVNLLLDDIATLRPTLFPSVPRLFNRIYDKIIQQALHSGSALKTAIFKRALDAKIANLRASGSITHPIWDTLIFSKVKSVLGGRVRIMVSASAPISSDVIEFLRVAFSCTIVEAYGQTESTGGLSASWPSDTSKNHVGPVMTCNELKLVSVPEMNYHARDLKGEIWVRGPNVFAGYLKDPAKTKETITQDGWLLTGDIGSLDSLGRLSIIDRKKNIFKLAQGEYIAPEKLENSYTKSPFIAQIYVHGDSLQSELVAVVVPDAENALKWGQSNNHPNCPPSLTPTDVIRQPGQPPHPSTIALAQHPQFVSAILADMTRIAQLDSLRGFEYIKSIHVEPKLFSIEDNVMTPTFKLKRTEVRDKYRAVIDDLYRVLNSKKKPESKL